MRKREVVWEDPRFRSKKKQPKALKINKFGEAPCALPPAHVPKYATASIPSGMTAPPCPRPAPAQAAAPAAPCGPGRAATCRRPPPSRSASGFQCKPPARPSSGMAPRPAPVKTPVIVATRPPSQAPHGGARPKQMMYRPGTALQRPCPQAAAETSVCPPRPSMLARPMTAMPCPPPPCPAPCPPPPCPAPCPVSPRRSASPPCPRQSPPRFSGLPQPCGLRPPTAGLRPPTAGLRPPSGLRPPTAGLRPPSGLRPPTAGLRPPSGLRPPTAAQATTIVARRQRSPEPCPPAPCPPEPCPPEPCPPPPCPAESRSTPCPPQMSTPRSVQRGLSRLMGPGSYSRSQQPKPQKIVLLPGDINPLETTVITVEPPAQPEASRARSPMASAAGTAWQDLLSEPFDFSPPSMASYRREATTCGIAPTPYIPPEILAMAEAAAEPCAPCAESVPETPQYETSSALLVDIEPYEPCEEPRVLIEPVDLITFAPPDPFSPERLCRPPSPSVTPPPNPFTPPKDPIPEPSELDKWASQYPRYKEAYTSSFHPVGEWARLKFQQKAQEKERELVAKSVPFNKNVSTICKDDDDDYDEDLGLLLCMPDADEENFNAPLDYAALRRQEEIERERREARRRERERQERGPTLAETRDLLARIRAAESARRAEIAGSALSSCQPATMTQEEMRRIHDRVLARHAGVEPQPQQSDISCLDADPCGFLEDVQLDDIDLDAIDNFDECPDF